MMASLSSSSLQGKDQKYLKPILYNLGSTRAQPIPSSLQGKYIISPLFISLQIFRNYHSTYYHKNTFNT